MENAVVLFARYLCIRRIERNYFHFTFSLTIVVNIVVVLFFFSLVLFSLCVPRTRNFDLCLPNGTSDRFARILRGTVFVFDFR